jgi:uncharacterized protein HemX
MDEPALTPPPRKAQGSGGLIAIAIILIILVLGGIYYLAENVHQIQNEQINTTTAQDQEIINELQTQGSSDTAAAIQADLDSTDLAPVDQSVEAVGTQNP